MKKKINWWLTISIVLSVLLVIIILLCFFNKVLFKNIVFFLFVTDTNKANWIGITSVIALLGLAYNYYDGKRKFKSEVRSKNRIQWMNTVRDQLANYIAKSNEYGNLILLEDNTKPKYDNKREIITVIEEVHESYYKIKLYIPDKEQNYKILNNVEELFGLIKNIDDDDIDSYLINNAADNLITESSKYFAEEWERVKIRD
ncbi:hypothetical protein [Leuconostoc citreum]|uniref:hypothetical protein n=1 Tax=Leuconostoc citreum TaxID=33964 RepID=UPI0029585EAE|nr:hypothetical protein [Leuconostoc citreum]MDV8931111.1 hypothetical protein [Leuconostoc citreum]